MLLTTVKHTVLVRVDTYIGGKVDQIAYKVKLHTPLPTQDIQTYTSHQEMSAADKAPDGFLIHNTSKHTQCIKTYTIHTNIHNT